MVVSRRTVENSCCGPLYYFRAARLPCCRGIDGAEASQADECSDGQLSREPRLPLGRRTATVYEWLSAVFARDGTRREHSIEAQAADSDRRFHPADGGLFFKGGVRMLATSQKLVRFCVCLLWVGNAAVAMAQPSESAESVAEGPAVVN